MDGERLLGNEVNRSMDIESKRAAWDIHLIYPPGAEWIDKGLPPPEKVISLASDGVVIGAWGTLPPKGVQSVVPTWLEDRVDVVGEQAELAALLSGIAVPFVARYHAAKWPAEPHQCPLAATK